MDMYLNNSGVRDSIAMLQAMFLLGVGFFLWCYVVALFDTIKSSLKDWFRKF